MTLPEFKAHIRTLGDFTNVHAQNLYARYLAGALSMDRIAATAPPKIGHVPSVVSIQPEKYRKPEPALKKPSITTQARLIRQADEEDNILTMFGEHEFITTKVVMEALGYSQGNANLALRRLEATGVIYHRRHAHAGFTHFYYLSPVEREAETV